MFQIACFPHLQQAPCTGRPEADCEAFLLLHGKQATAVHSREVARQAEALAQRFGCPVSLVRHAAWLHDISAVLSPDEMQAYAQSQAWDWDPAEQAHPFLLHQRISADIGGYGAVALGSPRSACSFGHQLPHYLKSRSLSGGHAGLSGR